QPDMGARQIANLPYSHIRMIDRYIGALYKAEAEQAARSVERRPYHVVEDEIRLHLGLVEVVSGLTDFLGVIAPVPGRNRLVQPFGARNSLERCLLFACFLLGGLPNLDQQ